jgi:hypothetical protein
MMSILALQRTRPAATVSRIIKGNPDGPVR